VVQLQKCTRCLLPETHETITFDNQGLCSVCINYEKKQVFDWNSRNNELLKLVAEVKSRNAIYDCIIPFSGGKDSTFSLYYAIKELGLKVLVVSFDHGFYRENLLKNRERSLNKLGADLLVFKPNLKLVKRLMIQSLKDKGDFCWHCHTGISSYPLQIAVEKSIPLVLWGESSSEYTNYFKTEDFHSIDEVSYNRIANLGISAADMYLRLNEEFELRDFHPFTVPSLGDLQKKNILTFPLGNYIKWNTKNQVQLIKDELGWEGDEVEGVPLNYNYEKIECMMQGVRDFIKFTKRGYARTSHLASIDIRHGLLSRKDGLSLVEEHEGQKPYSLKLFLDFLDLTENDLFEIIGSQTVQPWNGKIPVKIGKKPHDFEVWESKLLS
jgi:N-acetyl sugar amidotransferase